MTSSHIVQGARGRKQREHKQESGGGMVFQLECFLVGSVLALVLKPCGLECHANNTLLYLRAPIDAPLDEMHSVFLLINCNAVVVYQYVWAHSCALSQGHTQQHTLAYIHTLIVMINVPLLGDKINQFLCHIEALEEKWFIIFVIHCTLVQSAPSK